METHQPSISPKISEPDQTNILIIRMLGIAEVASIGLPAIRYFQKKYPDAQISFLTFSYGIDLIQLAEPNVKVINLAQDQWPDALIPAMENFLGLAEKIVGVAYDQIINLDTNFMPCFLARFLKDAGERLMGNYMNQSVQSLIDQFQNQSLQPEYVQSPAQYMDSTFASMQQWYTRWWQSSYLPEQGYPEYFLRQCCQFSDIEFDMSIPVVADEVLLQRAKGKKIILLANQGLSSYPNCVQLKAALDKAGYFVWQESITQNPIAQQLAMLKVTDLVISCPDEIIWLARTQATPTLLFAESDSANLVMPEYQLPLMGEYFAEIEQIIEKVEAIFAG